MTSFSRSEFASYVVAKYIFQACVIIFAPFTLLTHAILLVKMNLIQFEVVYGLTLLAVFYLITKSWRGAGRTVERDWAVLIMLGLLCSAGAFVAMTAIRPDSDDIYYSGNIVYILEHPTEIIDLSVNRFQGLQFESTIKNIFQFISAIELFHGAAAHLTGLRFLDFYHVIWPGIGGFLIPLGWFLVLSRFTRSSIDALAGAVIVVLFLLLDNTTHRSFGNFAFVRIWQGKAALLSIGLPVLIAFSIDFLSQGTIRYWITLFFTIIAVCGLTKVSLFMLPLLAIFMCGGNMATSMEAPIVGLKRCLTFMTAFGYVIFIAFPSWLIIDPNFIKILNENWAGTYWGQVAYILGDGISGLTIIVSLGLLATLILANRWTRLFLVGWIASFLIIMNPFTFDFVALKVTSHNTYWRALYLFPFPLTLGLAVASSLSLIKRNKIYYFIIGFIFLAIGAYQLCMNHGFGVLSQKTVRLDFMEYKVPLDLNELSEAAIRELPSGLMLGPPLYPASWFVLYTSKFQHWSPRNYYWIFIGNKYPQLKALAQARIDAARFTAGESRYYATFIKAVEESRPNSIILKDKVMNNKVEKFLIQIGYTKYIQKKGYAFFGQNN